MYCTDDKATFCRNLKVWKVICDREKGERGGEGRGFRPPGKDLGVREIEMSLGEPELRDPKEMVGTLVVGIYLSSRIAPRRLGMSPEIVRPAAVLLSPRMEGLRTLDKMPICRRSHDSFTRLLAANDYISRDLFQFPSSRTILFLTQAFLAWQITSLSV